MKILVIIPAKLDSTRLEQKNIQTIFPKLVLIVYKEVTNFKYIFNTKRKTKFT